MSTPVCTISDETWKKAHGELEDHKDWTFEIEANNLKVLTKKIFGDEYDMPCFRGELILNRPVELVWKCFKDHESRVKYSQKVKVAKVIYETEDFDVIYQIADPPLFFMSQRDMLCCRRFQKHDDGFDIVIQSTDHNDYPEKDAPKRTKVIMQAIKLRRSKEDPNKTHMTAVNQMHLGIWVPKWLMIQGMKLFSGKLVKWLEEACDDFKTDEEKKEIKK